MSNSIKIPKRFLTFFPETVPLLDSDEVWVYRFVSQGNRKSIVRWVYKSFNSYDFWRSTNFVICAQANEYVLNEILIEYRKFSKLEFLTMNDFLHKTDDTHGIALAWNNTMRNFGYTEIFDDDR